MSKLLSLMACAVLCVALSNTNTQANEPEKCETSKPVATPYGQIKRTDCTKDGGIAFRSTINVNGAPVLADTALFYDDGDSTRRFWIYQSGTYDPNTACPKSIYLVDLATTPVRVISFGVKNACNRYHWASWGKNRSVIALKNNVRFTYDNGKMNLPKAGERLWKSIAPPEAGEGMTVEDAIPFAEDVPPPK